MTTNDFLDDALTRAEALTVAYEELLKAKLGLTNAHEATRDLVTLSAPIAEQTNALTTIVNMLLAGVRDQVMANIYQAAHLLARQVVEDVRSRGATEPIVWLTSNAYMPPLRDLPAAERVWQLGHFRDVDTWQGFVETLERELEQAQVYMTAPEHDNSLYAVDLRVWEAVDEEKIAEGAEDLAGEWRRIPAPEEGGDDPTGMIPPKF